MNLPGSAWPALTRSDCRAVFMTRIARRFSELKAVGRTGLIPFVTAGDLLPEALVPLMHALVAAGDDLIELGLPFSVPMADGPVI